jgi:predicted phosphodiesterase
VRILALYDIHGNIDALEAVLADPRAAQPDAVVIGGDAVPGPFARATLERLDLIAPAPRWVRGNGEREVAEAARAASAGLDPPGDDDLAEISARELGPDRALALHDLPLILELDGILFCHATPRRDDEMLTRLSPPDRLTDALAGINASLVVAGHTHQQDDRMIGATRFVNAGSVGMPYEGDSGAYWLWIEDGRPALRRTPYDAAVAGARILAAGWPDQESINASLIDPVDPLVVTNLFENA